MKKLLSVLLSLIMACALFYGCDNTPSGDGDSDKEPHVPTYETTETFRIGNWGVPPHENTGYMEYANNPDYCNLEEWTKFHDCGFNLAIPTSGKNREDVLRDLVMADEVGMKVLVRDQSGSGFETLINYGFSKGYGYDEMRELLDEKSELLKGNLDEYKKHESFQGVNAYDEPSMVYYELIAACQDWFLKYYPEYEFYANLLPVYAKPKQLYGKYDGGGGTRIPIT